MSGLDDALNRLAVAFADVPRPTAITTCECCFNADQVTALLAPVPLADVPADVVLDHAAHAMGTIGAVEDFRYFLPRVLRLLLVPDRPLWPDIEVYAQRMRAAAWTTWPPAQTAAIREVLGALWAQTVASHPSDPEVDTALCVIGNAEDDLTPYLRFWTTALANGEQPAAQQLHHLLSWSARSTGARWRLTKEFWEHRDAPVGDWLSSESLRAAIRAGFDASSASEETVEVYADLAGLLGA